MIIIIDFLFSVSPVLAWSLIDPNSDAIKTGVIKPNAVLGMLINSTTWIFGIIGAVALLAFIIGGVMWLISAGRSQMVDKGKHTMVAAALGMAVVFLSYSGVDFVLKTFGYYRYAEWSTLPQQAEPRGIEGGTGIGINAMDISGYIPRSDPIGKADPNAIVWDEYGYDAGIKNQRAEASAALQTLLECMRSKMQTNVGPISSISDSQGIVKCTTNYARPPCAHCKNSCHYGGNAYNYSHAVDFGDEKKSTIIISAANECGGRALNEGTHIHVTTSHCKLDCPKD